MDPLQPITPRPALPVIDRAAGVRRVGREREDDGRQQQHPRRESPDQPPDEGDHDGDDGHPHVDITV